MIVTSLIVSIPVDLTPDPELSKLEEKGVKARYVAVERLMELPNGKVEWRMATASRAEGMLPQYMTERAMPSSISNVRQIPSFALRRSLNRRYPV